MDFERIVSDLKNKVYHPVYFLQGEEPYYIDAVSDYIEKHVLDDAEREFNQTVLYGGETNIREALAEAKAFPMLANYRVVIVKEAQNLKDLVPREKPEGEKKAKEEKEKVHPLLAYLDNPQKSTLLVFCHKYKTVDMRTAVGKTIAKKAVVLKSETPYDNQIPKWIENFLKEKNYSIEPRASQLLTEFLGNDLSKIANELSKLFLNIPEKSKITADHIQKFIGISKEYNNFELQEALGRKDVLRANRIIQYFAANPKDNSIIATVATLAGYFSKILIYHAMKGKPQNEIAAALRVPPFFIKDYAAASANYPQAKVFGIISILREYDMKSKGYETAASGEAELLKEMVYKILH